MFISKNSIIQNQIIYIITFSASGCSQDIAIQVSCLVMPHTHYKPVEVLVLELASFTIVAWALLKASLKYFEIQR